MVAPSTVWKGAIQVLSQLFQLIFSVWFCPSKVPE